MAEALALTTPSSSFCVISVQMNTQYNPTQHELEGRVRTLLTDMMSSDLAAVDRLEKVLCARKSPKSPLDQGGEFKSEIGNLIIPSFLPAWPPQVPAESTLTTVNAELGTTEFILSNGMHVCVKNTASLKAGHVSFQAFALGGCSELTEEEDLAFSLIDDVCQESGLLHLTGEEMAEIQSQYKCRVNTQRHLFHRGIGGSCPKEHLELMLQFLYLKMTSIANANDNMGVLPNANQEGEPATDLCQKMSPEVITRHLHRSSVFVDQQENSPDFFLVEEARRRTVGDHPLLRPASATQMHALCERTDVELQDLFHQLYARAFVLDPTNFRFVFVGDFPEVGHGSFRQLLEAYLGKLRKTVESSSRDSQDFRITHLQLKPWMQPDQTSPSTIHVFSEGRDDAVVKLGESDKATTLITIATSVAMGDEVEVDHLSKSACQLVRTKLLDCLRHKISGVYNVQVEYGRRSLSAYAIVSIVFTSCPTLTDFLVKEAIDVLKGLHETDGILEQEVDTIRQVQRTHHASALQNPSAWLFWMLDSYKQIEAVKRERGRTNALDSNFTESPLSSPGKDVKSGEHLIKSMLLRSTAHFDLIDGLTPQTLQAGVKHLFDLRNLKIVSRIPGEASSSTSSL